MGRCPKPVSTGRGSAGATIGVPFAVTAPLVFTPPLAALALPRLLPLPAPPPLRTPLTSVFRPVMPPPTPGPDPSGGPKRIALIPPPSAAPMPTAACSGLGGSPIVKKAAPAPRQANNVRPRAEPTRDFRGVSLKKRDI